VIIADFLHIRYIPAPYGFINRQVNFSGLTCAGCYKTSMNTQWSEKKLATNQKVIDSRIETGGRITPLLQAPEIAYADPQKVAVTFVDLLNSGDKFAPIYIEKALNSSMNSIEIIARQVLCWQEANILRRISPEVIAENDEVAMHIGVAFGKRPELAAAVDNLQVVVWGQEA
jgi:hypothetical protein